MTAESVTDGIDKKILSSTDKFFQILQFNCWPNKEDYKEGLRIAENSD